jgi:hypothetical protein
MAVEFEDPGHVLHQLEAAGIRVAKVQATSGLRVLLEGDAIPALDALASFADDVYLHQVVERRADGTLRRHLDLPEALREARAASPFAEPSEWRVHFHVPVFSARYGRFEGTQAYVADTLRLVRERTDCTHFEVETYTWGVLPEEFRRDDIVTAVVRELRWAESALRFR